ncbi:hypothetical protein [Gordonia hongkongensis]|uniref:hypothetical protein n=1 Tax=Gordonia hongkongensis TaxID=1701090 RepID=UPI003EBD791F
MGKRQKNENQPRVRGEDHTVTNWDASAWAEYEPLVKGAKQAGKTQPKPSGCNTAPSCFEKACAIAEDQIHHELAGLWGDIAPDLDVLAMHGHLARFAASRELSEGEERLLRQVRVARQHIASRVQMSRPRLMSILALHGAVESEMKSQFRKNWPFAQHFDSLEFPIPKVNGVEFVDGAPVLAVSDFLPSFEDPDRQSRVLPSEAV